MFDIQIMESQYYHYNLHIVPGNNIKILETLTAAPLEVLRGTIIRDWLEVN